ncbi:hypothetical protein [Allochromatium palmeri]|uniref:Uncharacterized protein n=1 Tax=Allochromatium palmeri TaxID=231048 RepID=A0A6N8EDT3_9GAMM|nr:hypothetical protein [Allochromatium palmeri]MTW21448.1 hypothetical protein [Allochromatium palmeri]
MSDLMSLRHRPERCRNRETSVGSWWAMWGAGVCLLGLSLGVSQSSQAADWSARLPDGSGVEIDASSHRAWRLEDGQRTPLWDGVHRLEDGSIVIVRDGMAVPNSSMLETWGEAPPRQPPRAAERESGSCLELVQRVCGEDAACAGSEPCRLARELLEMSGESLPLEVEAQAESSVGSQCREALTSAFFAPCH